MLEEAGAAAARQHTIQRLYQAFERCDGEAMQALYAPQATFDDPVFSLHGAHEIGGMWRMLTRSARKRSRDEWSLKASEFHVDGQRGNAHWEATYLYGTADRRVHNVVDAAFEFNDDGLILSHVDHFDFAAWARQALGLPGQLLGWSPWLQRYARRQAADKLARFLANHL
ncbi:MAG: nuclear transport factor 2 family protein [Rubrivivax sp.]|nr:nuclear transport factor 2 family protein [Rubrivivax sp.]